MILVILMKIISKEPMPEPTATELAKEAEPEAAVFAQAVNVEKLLNLLRAFDPAKDNLADNEEIQVYFPFLINSLIARVVDTTFTTCRNCTGRAWHYVPRSSS